MITPSIGESFAAFHRNDRAARARTHNPVAVVRFGRQTGLACAGLQRRAVQATPPASR